MYSPEYIAGVNFKSYPRFLLEFKKGKTLSVYGNNLDDEGSVSNGCGKSVLVEAVAVLLTDIPKGGLPKDDFILDGEKSALLVGEFTNSLYGTRIKIKRKIYRKDSNTIEVWEDGKRNTQITSVAEGNDWILTMLQISKEDLLEYYILNQGKTGSFFTSTDGAQKKVIGRFSNTKIVDEAIEKMAKKVKEVDSKKQLVLQAIERLRGKNEAVEESLEYEKEGRKDDVNEEASKIKSKISFEKKQIEETKKCILSLEKSIADQEAIEATDNTEKIKELEVKIKERRERRRKAEDEKNEAKSFKKSLELVIEGAITCPKCKYSWSINDAEIDLEEAKKGLKDVENLIKVCEEKYEKLEKIIKNANTEKQKLEEVQEEYLEVKEVLKDYTSDLNDDKRNLKSSKEHIESLEKQLKDLQKVDTKRIKELEEEIKEIEAEIEKEQGALAKLNEEHSNYNFWRINYAAFKTDLVNNVLQSLEGYINYYLDLFKTFLTVKIEGFSTTKEGEIRERISVLVSKDGGNSFQRFARYSGGQKGRINICGILTIQSLINSKSSSGGLDMLLMDEVFDSNGLDQKGQGEIMNLLDASGVTGLLISHGSPDVILGESVFIEFKNQLSRILRGDEVLKNISLEE